MLQLRDDRKAKDGVKGCNKGKRKTTEGNWKRGAGKFGGSMGGHLRKNRKVGDTKDRAGRAARSDTGHEEVDGASLTSTRKRQTAEKAGDNLNQSEKCKWPGVWRRSRSKRRPARNHTHREVEGGADRPGCRSKHWAREDRRGDFFVTREGFP